MDVYDYADKLLECFSDKLPDQLEVNENSFACVHNLFTENDYFPKYESHKILPNRKSDKLALDFRLKGNEMFRNGKFYSALCFYNESLCYALPTSDSLGLAFANRSAVYSEIDEFDLCFQNIQWAKHFNYPKGKLGKLKKREDLCRRSGSKKLARKELLKLSHKSSLEYPFVIDALKLKEDKEFGRHIVTERKLEPGDVIVIEKPFIALLSPQCGFKRCTNCLGQFSLNLLPCHSCTTAMFCSQSCMDKANEKFHHFECDFTSHAFGMFFSIAVKTALRTFLEAFHICGDSIEKLKCFLEQSGDENATMNDAEERDQRKKLLKAVDNLTTNEDRRHPVDKFRKISVCAILIDFLRKHSKLDEILETSSNTIFFANFMYKHIQIAESNYHELYALKPELSNQVNEQFGVGSFPFCSRFSHSCAPNVMRLSFDGCNTLIVSRYIEKGEQIFDNYGFHHNIQTLERRQQGLLDRYQFKCNCEACSSNFPLFAHLPEIDENFDKLIADDIEKVESFSVKEARQAIAKFSLYISKHATSYPCYEISLLQECMLRCFRAFEKCNANVSKKLIED